MPSYDFHDYVVHDLMSHVDSIQSRAMFGGWGLYKNNVVFGIIADDQLYFKVDVTNRKDYERSGSLPFSYEAAGRKKVMVSYWEVPADVMEDREKIEQWIERSCNASRRSKRAKPARRRNS